MINCDASGPLMIQVTKLYNKLDCSKFDAFGRVFSGTIHPGTTVKVLGEGYTLEDEEDMVTAEVSKIWIHNTR